MPSPPTWRDRVPRVVRRPIGRTRRALRVGARPLRSTRRALDPNLRRAYPHAWREQVDGLGATVGAVLAVVLVGLIFGLWTPAAVLGLALVGEAAVLAWRARPDRGRHQGWPVGSIRDGHELMTDPGFLVRAARRHGPVFKANEGMTPTCCVIDLDLGAELLRAHSPDLPGHPGSIDQFIPGGAIRCAEEPAHTELRRRFSRALSPRLVATSEPALARGMVEHLRGMTRECATTGQGCSPVPHIAELALAGLTQVVLGVPHDSPAYGAVRAVADDFDGYRAGPPLTGDVPATLDRLADLVVEADRDAADADGPTSLASELERQEPGALGDPATMRNLIFLTLTARDDVAGLLTWVWKNLDDHPAWATRLRSDGPEVANRLVSETLRLAQSERIFRQVRREIRFRDFVIPAGWFLDVGIREIHRDPARIPRPDEFDPDRFLAGGCGRDVYAPLGIGARSCIGEGLVRSLGRVFATELVRGFDWQTTADGPVELSRLRHWAPSSRWRVRLTAGARPDAR